MWASFSNPGRQLLQQNHKNVVGASESCRGYEKVLLIPKVFAHINKIAHLSEYSVVGLVCPRGEEQISEPIAV